MGLSARRYLFPDRWCRRTHHARGAKHTKRPINPTQSQWREYLDRFRCLARFLVLHVLGPNSMVSLFPITISTVTDDGCRQGLLGRKLPSPCQAKGYCIGKCNQSVLSYILRAKHCLIRVYLDWLWNFLLSFFAPRIAARIGPLILLIFFGMLVFGFGYVWLFIPETKGLSLEEVCHEHCYSASCH